MQNWTEFITFDVDIKDPCRTSTFIPVVLTNMSVIVGEYEEQAFTEAVDTAEQTYGTDSCGARSYTIILRNDATLTPITYLTVEEVTPYTDFKIITADENTLLFNEGTYQLSLYTAMVNYPTSELGSHPTHFADFDLVISPAVCDCSLLTWIEPASQSATTSVNRAIIETMTFNHPIVDESSKETNAAIKSCYRNDVPSYAPCDETTTITSLVE